MASTPLKGGTPTNEAQPQASPQPLAPRVIDAPPAATIAQAVARDKRLVDQAK
jgi:hypothetical protein